MAPSDAAAEIAQLRAMVAQRDAALAQARAERDVHQAEIDKLRFLIKQLQRTVYGRRSERLDPDQLQFGLEELEQSLAGAEAAQDAAAATRPTGPRRSGPRRTNRGNLPADLPREEIVIEPAAKACACCGGALHVIAEDRSEQLDIVPAQLKVIVTRRPKYGCRTCEGAVVQAPAPARPIDGGMASEALVAHVIVAKYCDHLPLYRQAQIFARQGIELDRSTLAEWVGRAAWWLGLLHDRLMASVVAAPVLFADDTPLPVLDPGRGRTKIARLWGYARDERPWAGPAPPAVGYLYSESREHRHPIEHLRGFGGVLQVDAFQGFDRLAAGRADGEVVLAHCWAHARRRFFEIEQATRSPIAAEALRRIAELYAVEATLRGHSAEARRIGRQAQSRVLVEALRPWLAEQQARVPTRGKLGEAIGYLLSRWPSFTRFLDDGRVELDNNTVERAIRPIALTRKNALFAGSDGGGRSWATIASLIQTAKLNGVEPFAYLRDTLKRIVAGHPANRLDELLPWNYASSQ